MLGSGMNLITTVIGFGMSVTFIVFVCTRIICCWRFRGPESMRGSESRRIMFEIESGIDLEPSEEVQATGNKCSPLLRGVEHRVSGLEQVLVAAIPTMKFSSEAFSSVEDAQCSICLGEYQEKEVLRIMPKCGHNFHLSCIDVWLRKQSTCPVCRFPIKDSLEPRHLRQATISMVQSLDNPETSNEHSEQWLNPGNQRHIESVPGNPELASTQPQSTQ